MNTPKVFDLVIVGGGPAGMSAALVAGRSLLNTVIINAEQPRNQVTTASHGFLSRDGISPLELLEISKQQLSKYDTVTYIKGWVSDVENADDNFLVTVGNIPSQPATSFETKNILFATGSTEDVTKSNLSGIQDVYGKTVFPCPFCDGWEHHGQKLAVFGGSEHVTQFAKMIAHWSNDIIIFTNGQQIVSQSDKQLLMKGNITVVEDPIMELVSDQNGNLQSIHLQSGQYIERDAGFLLDTHGEPSIALPEKLGVSKALNEWGIETPCVDTDGGTNVRGIYVVGDARVGFGGIVASANDGAHCVTTIIHKMVKERWASLEQDIISSEVKSNGLQQTLSN